MKNQHSELNELGWSDWFEQRSECRPTDTIARVAAVDREQLLGRMGADMFIAFPNKHLRDLVSCILGFFFVKNMIYKIINNCNNKIDPLRRL